MRRLFAVVGALTVLGFNDAAACPAGMEQRARIELYFGRNIGEMPGVSDEAWVKFLDEEITTRFPYGLSVIDLAGQWKDPASGRIVRETSKQLIVIAPMTDAVRERLAEIVALYKTRHQQTSVLQVEQVVCMRD